LNSWNTSLLPDPPSRRAILAIAIFIFASLKQNECHRHLAGLKKYTLPYRGWFQYIVCPHYTSECLIYVALSLAASPPGRVVNSTVFTGLLFVAVNLGITANATQKWYADKFGAAKVASRWKMIPFIF
jgi:3-oxo-5-alpha-steroid 4-dehydrogenase 3